MNFIAPSMLLGLLAAAIPWLVHLIGKRRAHPVRFAAMVLLLRSEKRISARRRLREILLLLARTAMAASLPLMFARPFALRPADLPDFSFSSQSAVIVLDDSASMWRRRGGETLFDAARDRARTIVSSLPSDSEVALMFATGNVDNPVAELTAEKSRVNAKLDTVHATARVADFPEVMRRAALVLASSPRPERRIFVLTDLQAAGWGDDAPPAITGGPDVQIIDVGAETPSPNRAVVAVGIEPAPEAGAGMVAVTAEIVDFTGDGATALPVRLKIDGAVKAQADVDLAPGGRARKRFVTLLGNAGGTHEVQIELDADAFALDDVRGARVSMARTVRALVINGDARTVSTEDEVFFLERALKAGEGAGSMTTVLPDDVPLGGLANYNVVFLANVGQPSVDLGRALTRFVEAGGGLFLSVGNRVDTALWNERLARVLPQPLGVTRTASAMPGQSAGETIDNRPAERLAPIDRKHPLLASFAAHGEGLAAARFFKLMLLDPVPDAATHSVVLRFENGAPALVEKQVGRGRVLLLASTIDRDWTDLAIHPGFLPLVIEAARRLSGVGAQGKPADILAGQSLELEIGADTSRLEIVKPDGSIWVTKQERGNGARTVSFTDTTTLGFHQVRTVGFDGTAMPQPESGFVVNLDPRESDPTRLPPALRPDRASVKVAAAGQMPKRRVELWHGLAGLLIAIVLLESLLSVRWRRTVEIGS